MCVRVYVHVRLYICTYVVCMYVCMCIRMYVCVYICMGSYACKNKVHVCMTGKIVGGKLKTTAEADKESLQAGWFTSNVNNLPHEAPLRQGSLVKT